MFGMRISVIFLYVAFLSRFFLGNIDFIGSFSPSVFIVPLLLVYAIGHSILSGRRLVRTREAQFLVVIYLIYIAWVATSRIYNKDLVGDVIYGVANAHFFTLSIFVLTQYLLQEKKEIVIFAWVMGSTVLISSFFGIMQWMGMPWAWDAVMMLRPDEKVRESIARITLDGKRMPSLFQTSANFYYYLIAFGFFVLAWTEKAARPLKSFAGFIGLSLLVGAIFTSQFRSTIMIIACLPFIYYWMAIYRPRMPSSFGSFNKVHGALLVIIVLAITAFSYVESKLQESDEIAFGGNSLSRMTDLADDRRLELASLAMRLGVENPLVGAGSDKFHREFVLLTNAAFFLDKGGSMPPHNLFLNAFVYYGFPGVFLTICFLWGFFRVCKEAIRLNGGDSISEWVCRGAILGISSSIIVSMTHNNGPGRGAPDIWFLAGILCALISITRDSTSEFKKSSV